VTIKFSIAFFNKPKGKARLDLEFRIMDFVIDAERTCEVH